jgi:hypothetical protein
MSMPPAPNTDRARIYVSYADEDRQYAMSVVRWLNDSGWYVRADDRHAFATGQDWARAAAGKIETCDLVLALITPGWLVSKYCHYEYSYCAKRGKFLLPAICELNDVGLLPEGMQALPRVDLRRNRMVDFLQLKEVLTQADAHVARAASATEADAPRQAASTWPRALARSLTDRGSIWPLVAAFVVGSLAALGFWAWS